jgi:hypothetical protein
MEGGDNPHPDGVVNVMPVVSICVRPGKINASLSILKMHTLRSGVSKGPHLSGFGI